MINLYTSKNIKSLADNAYSDITQSLTKEFCDLNNIPFDNRLKIFMLVHPDSGGVGYYRVHQPCTWLNRLFGDKVIAIASEVATPELVYGWADVIVMSRTSHPEFYMFAKRTKAVTVYEIDDLLHDIPASNPASKDWNKSNYRYWWSKEIMWACHALQVSTAPLLKAYGGSFAKSVILENCVDLDIISPSVKNTDKAVRVGWAGSSTHLEDLVVLGEAYELMKKIHKDRVKFVMMGWSGKYISTINGKEWDVLRGVEREEWPGVPISEGSYYDTLANLRLDIGVAPIAPGLFNECKSNIKTLEYGALGLPVVASDVGPYQWLKDGETGLLMKSDREWGAALHELVQSPADRQRLGANLREAVMKQYDIRKRVIEYYDFYKSL